MTTGSADSAEDGRSAHPPGLARRAGQQESASLHKRSVPLPPQAGSSRQSFFHVVRKPRCLLMRRGFSFPCDPFVGVLTQNFGTISHCVRDRSPHVVRPLCRPWKSHTEKTGKAGAFGVE